MIQSAFGEVLAFLGKHWLHPDLPKSRRERPLQFYLDASTARIRSEGHRPVSNLDLRLRAHLYRKRVPHVHGLGAIREPQRASRAAKRMGRDSRSETKSRGGSRSREFEPCRSRDARAIVSRSTFSRLPMSPNRASPPNRFAMPYCQWRVRIARIRPIDLRPPN